MISVYIGQVFQIGDILTDWFSNSTRRPGPQVINKFQNPTDVKHNVGKIRTLCVLDFELKTFNKTGSRCLFLGCMDADRSLNVGHITYTIARTLFVLYFYTICSPTIIVQHLLVQPNNLHQLQGRKSVFISDWGGLVWLKHSIFSKNVGCIYASELICQYIDLPPHLRRYPKANWCHHFVPGSSCTPPGSPRNVVTYTSSAGDTAWLASWRKGRLRAYSLPQLNKKMRKSQNQ